MATFKHNILRNQFAEGRAWVPPPSQSEVKHNMHHSSTIICMVT